MLDLRSRLPRRRLGTGLVAAAVLVGSLAAVTFPGVSPVAGAQETQPDPARYANPLLPRVPGDGAVESCADPMVLRGRQAGDPYWYMYCTTDPLNDEDLDAAGNLRFHKIPMMRSRNLVDWTYVGDAFEANPSWAGEDAALWAPDVVYSERFDRYYLLFVVTDTATGVSGEPGCTSDSAIGVATSDSPTGPWKFSDAPVVAPRRAGPGCDFFWTFDPDVLGDSVGDQSVLYYGSYYGGVYGTPLTLTADGAVTAPAGAQRVAIGNRYEGTTVVRRGGYHYLFVSATNCCAGALTGYSVFVGRSRSPLGPFVDRQGDSLLAGRVGGTPVISMNGNRWTGSGHNTVFPDARGRWWTVYHAVDRADPFFETEPGFTKRPALLDPLDWFDGWPTVRAGNWASDGPMPAPAAQPGDPDRYQPRPARADRPGRRVPHASDDFSGHRLGEGWSWVREPAADAYAVRDGMLRWRTHPGDLARDSDTAPVLTRAAPRGDYLVQTRVRLDLPPEGCCFNYTQAGLVVYGDDDNYLKLNHVSIWETRQTEFAKELAPVPQRWPSYGNTVVGAPRRWTHLRLAVERLSGDERQRAGGDTERYTAYTSQDGRRWVRGGTWTHHLGPASRLGLVSMGGAGFTAAFDHVRVSRLRAGSVTATR